MDNAELPLLMRKPWSEKRLMKWLFAFITAIASIQFFQYYIFYNSSYPFPYLQNLTASYGAFYTYFLFVPIIFGVARFSNRKIDGILPSILFHLIIGGLIAITHLWLIHLLGWLQIYKWAEESYWISFRFLLSKWLHFEVLIYGFVVFIWRGLDYVKWTQLKHGQETGEPEKTEDNFLRNIKVKEGTNINYISMDQVRWIEAYDNYIKLRVNGRYYLVRRTLSGIEKQLPPKQFQRVHRSVIVAIAEVENIRVEGGNYQVILKDQTSLKLSRTYKEALETRLRE